MKKRFHFPRSFFMMALTLIIFLAYAGELFRLQVVNGEYYRDYAEKTGTRTVSIQAARGEILDRNGVELAVNGLGRNIVFDKAYMRDGNENEIILKLCRLLESNGEEWTDNLPIVVGEDGEYQFEEGKEAAIASIISECRLQQYATAQNCMDALIEKYECQNYSAQDARMIVSVRNEMRRQNYSFAYPYTFAQNVSDQTVAVIMENRDAFGGVSVQNTTVRNYVSGEIAPHVIGRVGAITEEQYKANKENGYKLTDQFGQFGVENSQEKYLHGTDGVRTIEIDKRGNVVSVEETSLPTNGNTVYLTIDTELQKVAQDALKANVEAVLANAASDSRYNFGDCSGAAAVVMKVDTGEVLTMATYPSYNLSTYVEDLATLASDDVGTPLVDRCTVGIYPPGSVMKPAVALAGLQEGKISASETINCNHIYSRFLPQWKFQCLGWHGNTNVRYALQVSCNIFFYETGFRLGIDKMNEYQTALGLGQKTGIELPEATGTLAGRKEREKRGATWEVGDTIQAAIGQSDNLFTPIQIASYISTIANGGTRYQAHVVKRVTDYSRTEEVVADVAENPTVLNTLNVDEANLRAVQQGMRQAITGGSVSSTLGNYPIAIAGKTGTATTQTGSAHGVFACYAPYENPEIAVVVVLEHGAHGYSGASTAKAILDQYFGLNSETEQETAEGDAATD